MNESNKNKTRVLIVGGGFGGLSAARGLAKADAQVTLIDRNNYHLFQPLLYQVATAGLSPGDIAEAIRSIVKRQKNTEVLMSEVERVDLEAKRLHLPDRILDYDYLILATGARYNYFQHPEWEKIAPGLKTVEDALEIRRKILLNFEHAELEEDPEKRAALLNFVVIGGGPTGVEMAGSIAELAHRGMARDFRRIDPKDARILLIEAGPRILTSFPETLSLKAEGELKKLGVELWKNSPVEKIDSTGVWIKGEWTPSQAVVWAAGVTASPLVSSLPVEKDRMGRAAVGPELSLPSHPEVFVIGDAAAAMQDGKALPGLAPVALQQGRYVARLLKRRLQGKATPHFHYLDKGQLATVGRAFAIAEIRRWKMSGFFAWLAWLFVHIFFLIGMQNRILVMMQWSWAYFTYERGARMITFTPKSTGSPESTS